MDRAADIRKKLLMHNAKLPRYTSYPTSPHFYEGISQKEVKEWYRAIQKDQTLSLYIHIPFCRDICWYCGCHTKATKRDEPIKRYLDDLYKEIELTANLTHSECEVINIHFGGGSPTILSPDLFIELMEKIKARFKLNPYADIAIEVDPRNITEAKVAAYAKAGVNRVSLGVQDFDKQVQEAIHRVQPIRKVYETVKLFRSFGIEAINFDLIYGLPHQSLSQFKETIDYATLLNPQRIALFGYAHMPWMKKHMRLIDESTLPSPEMRLELFDMASHQLTEKGYEAVGIDHFVRKDDPMLEAAKTKTLHRNFQGYTVDQADALLGLGASSISKLPKGYVQNHIDHRAYQKSLQPNELPFKKGFALNKDDRCRAYIIERLMCDLSLDANEVLTHFPSAATNLKVAQKLLLPLVEEELITFSEENLTIMPNARQIVRKVCAAFDHYLQLDDASHSQIA